MKACSALLCVSKRFMLPQTSMVEVARFLRKPTPSAEAMKTWFVKLGAFTTKEML